MSAHLLHRLGTLKLALARAQTCARETPIATARTAHQARVRFGQWNQELQARLDTLAEECERMHEAVRQLAPLQIRMARIALGLTQPRLARAAGVSIATVNWLETGGVQAGRVAALTASRILDVLLRFLKLRQAGPHFAAALEAFVKDLSDDDAYLGITPSQRSE